MLLLMIKRNRTFKTTHNHLCTHTLQRLSHLTISGQINSRVTAQDTTFKTLVISTGVIMPAPVTRADWVQKLSAEGINVPSSWTILQIKAHWAEVKAMQSPVGSEELEMRIKALKKASRKKADLVEFLQKESIPTSQSATIAQMFNAAEKTITEEYEPQGSELLGFGKFGNKTMQEVWEDHPSYIQWVSSDCRGVGHEPLASSSSGQVELSEETFQGCDSNTQEEGLCERSRIRSEGIRFQLCHGESHGLRGHRFELHGGHQTVQHGQPVNEHQGNDIHGRSTHGQGQGDRSIEAAVGSSTGRASYLRADEDSQQGTSRDVEFHELSANVADMITQRWNAQRNPYSQDWQSLVHHNRPILMELACFPNSLLSTEVERVFGKGSAIRVSNWNGGDLETPEGVKHTKKMLRRFRPVHLWISCECSPYCPLQRLNRKTPEQRQRLEEKQEHARNQYQGAIEVAETAFQLGTQVHWELAERCEAWQLQMITRFLAAPWDAKSNLSWMHRRFENS